MNIPRTSNKPGAALIQAVLLVVLLHSAALGTSAGSTASAALPLVAARTETTLHCDVPLTESLGAAQTEELSFDTASGEIVSFVVEKIDPSDPGFDPEWRVVRADGQPAASCGLWSRERSADCGPFPEAGWPYRLQVRDTNQDHAGTVKVNLQGLTAASACDQTPLGCGDWLWSPINDPTDSDLIKLSLSDGAVITASVYNWDPPGPDFMPEWRLLQGDGEPAPSCGDWTVTSTRTCGPLPAATGPYRIEVRDFNQDSFGICRVVLDECSATTAAPVAGAGAGSFALRLNSENPARSGASIRVSFVIDVIDAPTTSRTTLDVFDAAGRLVARVLDGVLEPGVHEQDWDARGAPAGLYLCRLRSGGRMVVTKLIVVS